MVRFNELRITNDGRYLIIDVSVRSQSYYNNIYLDSISIDTQDTYKDGGPSSSIVYYKYFGKKSNFDPVEAWGKRYLGSCTDGSVPVEAPDISGSLLTTYVHGMYIKVNGVYYKGQSMWNGTGYKWSDVLNMQIQGSDSSTLKYSIKPEFTQYINVVDPEGENEYLKSVRLELGVGDLLPSLSDNMFFVYVKVRGIPSPDTPCGMDEVYTLGVTLNTCPLYNAMMSYVRETNSKCNIPKNFIDMFLKFKAFETSVNTEHYAQAIEYYNKYIKNINKLDTSVSINRCSCNG